MRLINVSSMFVGVALVVCGCSNNSNNASNAHIPNALGQEVAPPPLATPDQISAQTRFAAGQLAESRQDFGGAIQQYNLALKIDPKHEQSTYRLGVLYTQTKQYPQAIETWRQYIRITKGSAIAYNNAAFCFDLAGKPAEAEECYKQGIKADPKNQPCRVNYGLMLAKLGRDKDAVEQLSSVLRPAEVHYNLGSVYEAKGRKDEAKAEYERALELDPTFFDAQVRLSKLE